MVGQRQRKLAARAAGRITAGRGRPIGHSCVDAVLVDREPRAAGEHVATAENSWGARAEHLHSLGSARPTKDRKSTRLNSSHRTISYAVFCLKKKIYV